MLSTCKWKRHLLDYDSIKLAMLRQSHRAIKSEVNDIGHLRWCGNDVYERPDDDTSDAIDACNLMCNNDTTYQWLKSRPISI